MRSDQATLGGKVRVCPGFQFETNAPASTRENRTGWIKEVDEVRKHLEIKGNPWEIHRLRLKIRLWRFRAKV